MFELRDKAYDVFRYAKVAIVLFDDMSECMADEKELRENYSVALEDTLHKLSTLATDLRNAINEAADAEKSHNDTAMPRAGLTRPKICAGH